MFSFDSITVWVGMRICWPRSNWEKWRGRRRKLKEDVGLRNNKKCGYFRLSLLTLVIAKKEEREKKQKCHNLSLQFQNLHFVVIH